MDDLVEDDSRGGVSQLDLRQRRVERSARIWLRAYPRRWRSSYGEDLVGTLLDLAGPDARTVRLSDGVSVVRAGWALRWREHPPLGPWLAYRLRERGLPAQYRAWLMDDLLGRRVGFRLNAGSTVSSDMLIPSSSLTQDEREVAVNVNSVTGVAGRVRPGDRVDLYAVFADVPGLPKSVKVLARDIRVVSIAGEQQVTQAGEDGIQEQSVIPVTLAVVPKVAMSLTYAANFAAEVRLVALPNDVGTDRRGEVDDFDASELGGTAVPEGEER